MTPRERYLETLLFGTPDRVPLSPGGPRESTLQAWHTQGLAADRSWFPQLLEAIGLDPDTQVGVPGAGPPVSFRMMPEFEERVLSHRDGHLVVQDWMGAIVEISDRYDVSYLRAAKDFVTRKWHKFPVESRADFEGMRARYDATTEGRFGADFESRGQALRTGSRAEVVATGWNGPFWQLREWCGFEGLCTLLMDDPSFVVEMVEFWGEFVAGILERVCAHYPLDRVLMSEDMAYKEHPMISPAMTRRFLGPVYHRWVSIVRGAGCRIVDVDSDGHVGELIPVWIDCGINVCCPMEVAAGNDIAAFRAEFGRAMAYTGGIDKRAIAKGGRAIEEELERRIPPLFVDGGYIPGCDHGVPPDISWPRFVEYSRLLAGYCGWV